MPPVLALEVGSWDVVVFRTSLCPSATTLLLLGRRFLFPYVKSGQAMKHNTSKVTSAIYLCIRVPCYLCVLSFGFGRNESGSDGITGPAHDGFLALRKRHHKSLRGGTTKWHTVQYSISSSKPAKSCVAARVETNTRTKRAV